MGESMLIRRTRAQARQQGDDVRLPAIVPQPGSVDSAPDRRGIAAPPAPAGGQGHNFANVRIVPEAAPEAPPGDDLAGRIRADRGDGSLQPHVQRRLERGLRADLSGVRLHTSPEADQLSRALDADAFSSGQDIFFRAGAYEPDSPEGLHLLAHEAAHTVQQSTGTVEGRPAAGGVVVSDPGDQFERAAEQAASAVLAGRSTGTGTVGGTAAGGPAGQATVAVQRGKKRKKRAVAPAAASPPSPATVRLRTALDSQVTVSGDASSGYAIALSLAAAGESLIVARYRSLASGSSLRTLPVYIEDVVTERLALVRVQFDPDFAEVEVLVADEQHGPQRVRVEAIPTSADQLRAAAAPAARDVGPGYVAEGREKVTEHSSASEIDRTMGAVASAEGGFASTEGSDQGIFTWGQGQWTVGANLLQPVMQFIKDRRADLYDRYWGAAGLDVRGNVFHYQGRAYAGKRRLTRLFRGTEEQNLAWVNLFAQAGQDPQIQRLQREYQRGEVREQLTEAVGGKAPDAWLDTRGKAFYYSMWVNLPAIANTYFKDACREAGEVAEPTEAIKQAVSAGLETRFRESGVTARSGDRHHYIAFWGEAGRNKVVAEAEQHIADPALDTTWTTEQWRRHKAQMERRESRYQKTKADIDRALARVNVEPDVPPELAGEFE